MAAFNRNPAYNQGRCVESLPNFRWTRTQVAATDIEMEDRFTSDIAFTPAVKATQMRLGSRDQFSQMERGTGWASRISDALATFIADRDSLYLATANSEGQPYVQHRGGPKGFVKVLDDRTLALADYQGNRQYVSLGNLSENDRAFIFFMDYAHQRRVKLWGRARFVEDDPELLTRLTDEGYAGVAQRALLFAVLAWDVNCDKHIVPRHTEDDIAAAVARIQAPLQQRIADLEAEVTRLRRTLRRAGDETRS